MNTALLLSGGLDSIALAWWMRPMVGITVDYGQVSAQGELRAAAAVCQALDITHEIVRVDCSALGSGDLAGRPALSMAPVPEWWPFRNQLLVTLAGIRCLTLGISRLLVGSVATDAAHADGGACFYEAIDSLMTLQEGHLRVEAPALGMTSADLIRRSGAPRQILAWAHSCHTGDVACGSCRGCRKHRSITEELWGEGY